MNRTQVADEIKNTLGVVPAMFKGFPDKALEHEWVLLKQNEMEEGIIPLKYRHLIGLGIASVIKCKYCIYHHTEFAKLTGATEQEIEEALRVAKCTVGWSAYVSGTQQDFEEFKQEVQKSCEHLRSKELVGSR